MTTCFSIQREPIIHHRQAVIMIRKSGIERNSTLLFGRRNSLSKCHPNINNRISFSRTEPSDRMECVCKTADPGSKLCFRWQQSRLPRKVPRSRLWRGDGIASTWSISDSCELIQIHREQGKFTTKNSSWTPVSDYCFDPTVKVSVFTTNCSISQILPTFRCLHHSGPHFGATKTNLNKHVKLL